MLEASSITYETIFFATAAILLISALFAVTTEKVMRAVIYLILTLVSVAVIFLLANSELMFGIQLSVYGGGISILMLFAVTLVEQHEELIRWEKSYITFAGIIILLFAVDAIMLILGGLPEATANSLATRNDGFQVVVEFSKYIWQHYDFVLPFISILLTGVMLGAVRLLLKEQPEVTK